MNIALPEQEQSYWLETSPPSEFPPLQGELSVDVAIVGGGIAGLTTAYILMQTGLKVAVLEKNTIASGTTGGSTGKVTAQHGLIYADLRERFGKQQAKTYANAYMQAMTDIEALVHTEKLACGWTPQDNFVYTADPHKVAQFRKEAEVAADLGLPASFESRLPLPFSTTAAVKFTRQAYFNPAAYVRELARLVQEQGSFVFEYSQANRMEEGTPCTVTTDHGTVRAKQLVIATKIPAAPLAARFTYASREHPHTSYIVAGKTSAPLQGMYISPDSDHYSILPVEHGKERLVFIGGENHIPGLGDANKRYEKLAGYAEKWFNVKQIDYKWKAMDYMAYDDLPLIGPLYTGSKYTYAITGFKKWGLCTSMVAAGIVRDYLHGEKTAVAELFYPHRSSTRLSIPRRVVQEIQLIFKQAS
jgi:glycine/D-amino acid oxidase-like deaminating enzyme